MVWGLKAALYSFYSSFYLLCVYLREVWSGLVFSFCFFLFPARVACVCVVMVVTLGAVMMWNVVQLRDYVDAVGGVVYVHLYM